MRTGFIKLQKECFTNATHSSVFFTILIPLLFVEKYKDDSVAVEWDSDCALHKRMNAWYSAIQKDSGLRKW